MKYVLDRITYTPEEYALKIKLVRKTQWEKLKAKRQRALKYYYTHKKECIERVRQYELKNPEKAKGWAKKVFKKWHSKKKNKKYMVKAMSKYYYANKDKQLSRTGTYKLKHLILNKKCKCGETNSLQIHHEIYPSTYKQIKQAIKDNKIYYVCSKCHKDL
jgi:hypothetical protein